MIINRLKLEGNKDYQQRYSEAGTEKLEIKLVAPIPLPFLNQALVVMLQTCVLWRNSRLNNLEKENEFTSFILDSVMLCLSIYTTDYC